MGRVEWVLRTRILDFMDHYNYRKEEGKRHRITRLKGTQPPSVLTDIF